jgi:hypothetical protein
VNSLTAFDAAYDWSATANIDRSLRLAPKQTIRSAPAPAATAHGLRLRAARVRQLGPEPAPRVHVLAENHMTELMDLVAEFDVDVGQQRPVVEDRSRVRAQGRVRQQERLVEVAHVQGPGHAATIAYVGSAMQT